MTRIERMMIDVIPYVAFLVCVMSLAFGVSVSVALLLRMLR